MAAPGSSLENNTGTSQAILRKQKNTIYCGTDIPEISTKMHYARRNTLFICDKPKWGGGGKGPAEGNLVGARKYSTGRRLSTLNK